MSCLTLEEIRLSTIQFMSLFVWLLATALFRSNIFLGTIQLQGEHKGAKSLYKLGLRELRFLAVYALFAFLPGLSVVEIAIANLLSDLHFGINNYEILGNSFFLVFAALLLMTKIAVFIRLAPTFGFIAMENKIAVRDSWHLTREKFWSLFRFGVVVYIAVQLIPVPGYIVGAIFFPLDTSEIFKTNASFFEMYLDFHLEMAKTMPSWAPFILPLNIFAQFVSAAALGRIYFSIKEDMSD